MGQNEKLLKEGAFGMAERLNFDPIVRPTEHGTEGDGEDVEQVMVFGALHAWVGEGREAGAQLLDQMERALVRHGAAPEQKIAAIIHPQASSHLDAIALILTHISIDRTAKSVL